MTQATQTGVPAATTTTGTPDFMIDHFGDERPPGGVIGTCSTGGTLRKGVDRDGVIGIDNGALRIRPLDKPRWGRSGIAYGPFTRRNGLAFGAFLLNGHNTSQAEPLPEAFHLRLQRWALGSETEPPLTRYLRCLRGRQRKFLWRRFWQWFRSGTRFFKVDRLDENLAVGWFPTEAPNNPLGQGNSFILHALGPECGGLWARPGSSALQAIRGLQNVQIYYFVVLREQGAAYYAASIPRVPGLDSQPHMRLLAIDAIHADKTVFAGVHQSVLGQIGFRAETRVYRTQVALLPGFDQWYGSAHGADKLVGEGPLHLSSAEIGGSWEVHEGGFQRNEQGLVTTDATNAAMLKLNSPSGLIHVVVMTGGHPIEGVGVIWRAKDEENFWCIEVGSRHCQLSLKQEGVWVRFPVTKEHYLAPNIANALQVMDDGENIQIHLNGALLYTTAFVDKRLQQGTGVGIRALGGNIVLRSFEAHPRTISVPAAFDLGKAWWMEGNRVIAKDDFSGGPADLVDRVTSFGAKKWVRTIGHGVFQLTGTGAAKVVGSVQKPCPGRTAYTIEWSNAQCADVAVRITPPGVQRGKREKGRGGLIFWQDDRHYITLTVFMDDWYGTSIAAFFQVDGFDELYDAVWTNVGRRIHWGVPYDFRVVCDGKQFLAFVNDEPVLYRALSDIYPDWDSMRINRVGIVANWEWGNDTGSLFESFVAKDKS